MLVRTVFLRVLQIARSNLLEGTKVITLSLVLTLLALSIFGGGMVRGANISEATSKSRNIVLVGASIGYA